ncbi:MAG: class II glutamine amidotransferase, partial [Clostridia bacterium]|nr:class II glutamine amidotransferase [Clostridia bacterium]
MKDLDINKGMCGIYGCLSSEPQNLIQETLRGLKILQYRGYDSAGIAYSTPKQLKIVKAVGDIEQLIKKIPNQPKSKVCIGHTRWATNGTVNIKNSHPHISYDGKIAVVHNGIIENYKECCKLLLKNNISLKTPVDTEVIPNILCLLSHNKHDICNFLKGQYVFCATEKNKNNLFLAKKGNLPLYIGHTKNSLYITSDTLTLPDTVTEIITMEDMDTCEITENKLDFYHKNRPIEKAWQPFNQSFNTSNKNGFSTYMEKEINKLNEFHKLIKNIQCIHICGCGTSYHAGLVLSQVIEENLHIRAIPHISSELSEISLLNESAIAIVISQSG